MQTMTRRALFVKQFYASCIKQGVQGCFLAKELSGRIDAYLKHCYRYGFTSKTECVDAHIQSLM